MTDSKKQPFSFSANFNTRSDITGNEMPEQTRKQFSIAMMGDFGGSKSASIGERQYIAIDRHNFDEVFASMALELTLPLYTDSDEALHIKFSPLKDSHPDKLYKNVEVFAQLRDLHGRLNDPITFKHAVEELGGFDEEETEQSKANQWAKIRESM